MVVAVYQTNVCHWTSTMSKIPLLTPVMKFYPSQNVTHFRAFFPNTKSLVAHPKKIFLGTPPRPIVFGDTVSAINYTICQPWNPSKNFTKLLYNRTPRVQDEIFFPYKIDNIVPQGEVFSIPFSLISINKITKGFHFPFTQLLFADDYISLQSLDHLKTHRLLQITLNSLHTEHLHEDFASHPPKPRYSYFKNKNWLPHSPSQIKTNKRTNVLNFLVFFLTAPRSGLVTWKNVSGHSIFRSTYLIHPQAAIRSFLFTFTKSLIRSQ